MVAVFRIRNSPVFELLPWCVAHGFGASHGVLGVGQTPSGCSGKDAVLLPSHAAASGPAAVALYPQCSRILDVLSIILKSL